MYKIKKTGEEDRRKAMLAILRERDAKISEVLLVAAHVALYELETSNQKHAWHKTEIEGSLYVVERSDNKPKLRLIVRNNQAVDEGDFEQDIDAKVELEIKDNTVFYKVGSSPVRGLWFHQADALEKFAEILKKFTPPPPRQDAGKALLAALGVGGSSATSAPVAPVAPVAAPAKIAAPANLPPPRQSAAPQQPPSRPSAMATSTEGASDAASLLREALGRGSAAAPAAILARAPVPTAPSSDRILVSKADLRLVLGEMVLGDDFVNELVARLANRQ
jgi:hypothetical protein